jgi:hypothetical protein
MGAILAASDFANHSSFTTREPAYGRYWKTIPGYANRVRFPGCCGCRRAAYTQIDQASEEAGPCFEIGKISASKA